MPVNVRLFMEKGEAVVEHAPLVLSGEDHIAAEQILEKAIRAVLFHQKS